MSVRPAYAHALLAGTKQAEFRTRYPALPPHDVVVYSTASDRVIIGGFRVARVDRGSAEELWTLHGRHGGIERDAYDAYFRERGAAVVALVVSDPWRLPRPVVLAEAGLSRPPQSYMYLPADALARLRR